ncbi:hypothetical protein A5647_18200 [Mycobacterium sp. 1100029.7]|nr:hypothetical protein A5647_18200 [Mycobacterium sp. 1100029.7]
MILHDASPLRMSCDTSPIAADGRAPFATEVLLDENTDDHSGNMAALGARAAPAQNPDYGNVINLQRLTRPAT